MEINIIPKFIDNALSKPAQAVGDTLTELWNLSIGNHVSLLSKKQEVRQQVNLKKYKDKIEELTHSIPEENLVEPQLHIVGPALEASKYYIESESLRNMFANLISASIDNRKIDKTHPSFVEIIKQMSPLDAQNLSLFKRPEFPICEYRLTKESGSYIVPYTNIFLENDKIKDINLVASSIANLNRLGLIEVDYSTNLSPEEKYYSKFEQTPLFKKMEQGVMNGDYSNHTKLELRKGITYTTPLGQDFIQICL